MAIAMYRVPLYLVQSAVIAHVCEEIEGGGEGRKIHEINVHMSL